MELIFGKHRKCRHCNGLGLNAFQLDAFRAKYGVEPPDEDDDSGEGEAGRVIWQEEHSKIEKCGVCKGNGIVDG